MPNKVIIDCDTGIDDALALTLALSSDKLDILGITTVTGNVDCENTTRNTCNVCHFLGRDDIRVAKGASKPLEREPFRASGVHGVTGLRGWSFDRDYKDNLVKDDAIEFMNRTISESSSKVTIIAIGPLTNTALLFRKYPEVKQNIERIVFMGTSYHCGNPTSLATFNVLADPEAFREVIFSGVEFVSCPLDVTRTAVFREEDIEKLKQIDSKVAEFCVSIMSNYGIAFIGKEEKISSQNEEVITPERIANSKAEGITMHDPATVAYVIAPELFTTSRYYCDVECRGELTTGFTLIDKNNYYRKSEAERNLTLIESIDRERFVELFIEAVKRYSK